MRLTWGPPGSCRPQMGPMLAPWTLLSGVFCSTEKWSNRLMMLSPANDTNLHVHIYIRVTSHDHWNISSHRSLDFLLKSVYRVTAKKTETREAMRDVTGIYAGNLPVTSGFSTRRPNNKESVSMSWSHHDFSNSPESKFSLFRTQRLDWLINDELSTKLGDYRSEIVYALIIHYWVLCKQYTNKRRTSIGYLWINGCESSFCWWK